MNADGFNANTHRAAFEFLCDRKIGSGMSREVFDTDLLIGCVVKVEERAGYFQNVIEWETWQRVKETDYAKYFAKCFSISADGRILVMEKTRPASRAELPVTMPRFFTDFKETNYGWVKPGDREVATKYDLFVCHDYGTSLIFENGLSKHMKRVEWRDAGS